MGLVLAGLKREVVNPMMSDIRVPLCQILNGLMCIIKPSPTRSVSACSLDNLSHLFFVSMVPNIAAYQLSYIQLNNYRSHLMESGRGIAECDHVESLGLAARE